jgi:hypothetical protein
MPVYRAGGHIDRGDGDGWVLDDTQPAPAPAAVEHQPLKPTIQEAAGWRLTPEPPPAEPEPEPEPEAEPEAEVETEEPEPPSDADVRAWAKAEGVSVPARGRISKNVVDQYLNRET